MEHSQSIHYVISKHSVLRGNILPHVNAPGHTYDCEVSGVMFSLTCCKITNGKTLRQIKRENEKKKFFFRFRRLNMLLMLNEHIFIIFLKLHPPSHRQKKNFFLKKFFFFFGRGYPRPLVLQLQCGMIDNAWYTPNSSTLL